MVTDAEPTWEELVEVVQKFAKHRPDCGCFICRTLTERQRRIVASALAKVL